MLMRTDPFRDLDRLTEAVLGTTARPAVMPMDAYRDDHTFVIHLDLPGVDSSTIDLTVEQNVLTIHAERKAPLGDSAERVVAERAYGVFSRQLFLGDTLDADHIEASYHDGVLTLRVPVAERAKPRRIEINTESQQHSIEARATDHE
jgi:HSP20 family protein